MNLVSHFYIDHHTEYSRFVVGSVTPDLLSIFSPQTRMKDRHLRKLDLIQATTEQLTFLEGLKKHFEADRLFHDCDFFHEECAFLLRDIKDTYPKGIVHRGYFLAHILVELILDKVVMKNHPELLDMFYDHFHAISLDETVTLTEWAMGHKMENYHSFILKFRSTRYLRRYSDWDYLIYVLKRIFRKVNLVPGEYMDSVVFLDLLERCEHRISMRFEAFFKEIF